jgi:hypothetical protein
MYESGSLRELFVETVTRDGNSLFWRFHPIVACEIMYICLLIKVKITEFIQEKLEFMIKVKNGKTVPVTGHGGP